MNRRRFLQSLATLSAALVAPLPEPVKRPVRKVARYFGYSPIVTLQAKAGEPLKTGDIVYMGADGKVYKQTHVNQVPRGIVGHNGEIVVHGHVSFGGDE